MPSPQAEGQQPSISSTDGGLANRHVCSGDVNASICLCGIEIRPQRGSVRSVTSDHSTVERTDQLYGFAIEASHLHVLYREIVGWAGIDPDAGK